jgi:serine/threonine-protein kinase
MLCGYAVGESDRETARGVLHRVPAWLANPRFSALMYQIGTEVFCAAGDLDTAAETLTLGSNGVLLDITWMDGCPVLAPLRAHPRWASAHAQVAKRAANVWR